MEVDGVLAFQIMPSGPRYAGRERAVALKEEVFRELTAIPGVQSLAIADDPPIGPGRRQMIEHDHRSPSVGGPFPATCHRVDHRYFDLLRIPLRMGLGFEHTDGPGSPRVAVVSEALARRAFAGNDPIGQRLRLMTPDEEGTAVTVVGVVGDVQRDPWGSEPKALYLCLNQEPSSTYTFLLKSTMSPEMLVPELRKRMQVIDPQQPLLGMETLRDRDLRRHGAECIGADAGDWDPAGAGFELDSGQPDLRGGSHGTTSVAPVGNGPAGDRDDHGRVLLAASIST